MAHDADATRFVRQFEQVLRDFLSGQPIVEAQPILCPQCLTPLAPNQEECAYLRQRIGSAALKLGAVAPVAFRQDLTDGSCSAVSC